MKPTKLPLTVVLLGMTAFLAPLLGGVLYVQASSLSPGVAPVLLSMFSGTDTPELSNLIVLLPALLCALVLAFTRRILQMPQGQVGIPLLLFLGVLTASLYASSYKVISYQALSHFFAYAVVFFTAASAAGRVRGPRVITGALVAGCTLQALMGIREWGERRVTDPTWRIFTTWNNPNALAGMLAVGLVLALVLALITEERGALAWMGCVVCIGFALFLTQSRGGILAALVGVALLGIALLIFSRKHGAEIPGPAPRPWVKFGAPLIVLCLLIGLTVKSSHSDLGKRLASNTNATEQSSGFRKLLWRGAVETIKAEPVGTGVGTYWYASTRSGLVAQTGLAHNTMLQLGVEGSVVAPLLLILMLVQWYRTVLRYRIGGDQSSLLRIGISIAVTVSFVEGLVESNLYYFGTGVTVFLLLGLGLQVASDGVLLEFTPVGVRRFVGAAAIGLLTVMAFFGFREVLKARVRSDRASGQSETIVADCAQLRAIAFGDGEAHYLLAFDPSLSVDARIDEMKQAAELEPSSRHLRFYGEALADQGKVSEAEGAFLACLARDPNNLLTLKKLMELQQKAGELPSALLTAQRMVEVESKPWFQVRALSELVPLETVSARELLAGNTKNAGDQVHLLQGAVDLYHRYALTTVPYLEQLWHGVTPSDIGGESYSGTLANLDAGLKLSADLKAKLQRLTPPGDPAGVEAAVADLTAAKTGLAALGGNK